MGAKVDEFETALRTWLNAKWIIGASDFSGALILSLYTAGVRPGDEVILSPMTCLATSMPIASLFAKPVWCDVDPMTGMPELTRIPTLITERTRAILAYHWSGDVASLDNLGTLCREAALPLIEDASEAFGAEHQDRRIGSGTADFTVFSFGAVRQLTCGEGAAIAVGNEETYVKLQRLRRYGIDAKTFRLPNGDLNPNSDIPVAGFNFPMNNIFATIGLQQFSTIDSIIAKYRENGRYYENTLHNIPGITLLKRDANTHSGFWTYSLRAERRDAFVQKLIQHGIGCQRLHVRNDRYSCFGNAPEEGSLPGVDLFDRENVSIPSGWWVDPHSREFIVTCIRGGW